MGKFCTSCGKELRPETHFCARCGAPVGSESAPSEHSYTQPAQQTITPQGQSYISPPLNAGRQDNGISVFCIVLAVLLVVQIVVVVLYGWPGFLLI